MAKVDPNAPEDPKEVAQDPNPSDDGDQGDKGEKGQKGDLWEYVKELRAENAKTRKKLQEALREREKERDAALAEQGKFKELYEKILPEHQSLKEQAEKFQATIEARREKLLEALPKEKRDLYGSAPLEILEDLAETFSALKKTPTKAEKSGSGDIKGKSYDQLTPEEIADLRVNNNAEYRRLYAEHYKKLNGREPPFIP